MHTAHYCETVEWKLGDSRDSPSYHPLNETGPSISLLWRLNQESNEKPIYQSRTIWIQFYSGGTLNKFFFLAFLTDDDGNNLRYHSCIRRDGEETGARLSSPHTKDETSEKMFRSRLYPEQTRLQRVVVHERGSNESWCQGKYGLLIVKDGKYR